MRKLIRAALVILVLVPAAAAMAAHGSGGSHGGGSHGGSGHGSHGGGSHGGSGHGWHGSGSHNGFGHGWHGGGHHGGHGWVVYGGPFWGGWGWWGWGCPFFPDCYGPSYVAAQGDDATYQTENEQDDWGTIDTEIWPDSARVYLDRQYIGTSRDFDGSDDYLYLKPGDYTLQFRLEGYKSTSLDLTVESGAKIELNRKLHRAPGTASVAPRIPPQPEGGLRRYWGLENGKLVALAGNEAQVQKGRDRNDEDDADDDADDDSASGVRLTLSVEPGDAVVYLDDHFIGTADEIRRADAGISVAPGPHTITVTRPGFKPRTETIDVSGGSSKTLELSLGKK